MKNKYARRKNKFGFLSSYYDVKIREIEKSIENLSSLENDYDKVSWTLDYGNALCDAMDKVATAYILEGQVSKNDIVALFDPNGKKEVIVRYPNIKNKIYEVIKNIKI